MKILLITVGRKNDPNISGAIEDFTSRIGHYASIEWKLVQPSDIAGESESIINALDKRDFVVLLDDKGKEMSTKEFAAFIDKRLLASTHRLVFIIGGAYGASEEVRKSSHTILSLSRMTFPHQLVRLIIIEQIYRAFTILKGEKYHHE